MILQLFIVRHNVVVRFVIPFQSWHYISISQCLQIDGQPDQNLEDVFDGQRPCLFIRASHLCQSFFQQNHSYIVALGQWAVVFVFFPHWDIIVDDNLHRLVVGPIYGQIYQDKPFLVEGLKQKHLLHELGHRCDPQKQSVHGMRLFIALGLLVEQCLSEPNISSICQIINSFPDYWEPKFLDQVNADNLLGFVGWKIHIFKEYIIFAEITQDVGVSGRVMKEFLVLDEGEVVIFFVHCVQGDLVRRCYLTARSITHKAKQNYKAMNQRRDFSLPHKHHPRQSLDQHKKSRYLNSPVSSRVSSNEYVLRYDINTLLSLFNEMEITGTGQLHQHAIKKILETIGLYNRDQYLKSQYYTFDHFLSVLGQIQVPSEPSVYVLSFVQILAKYQAKCVFNQEQGLEEAKAVEAKIKTISQNEIERQKNRLKLEHGKIYQEMQRSQYKQLLSFEDEWGAYLKDSQQEIVKKLQETRYIKKSKIVEEENKYLAKMRKTSVVTSPWLRQLMEKKKWLIHDKKYDDAIQISNEITREKVKLNEHKEEMNEALLHKKLQKISNKTNKYLGAVENNLQTNFNRLLSKKKEGESMMKIKMKKLREEATRKLNEHFKNQVNRLKRSFYLASNQ